LLLFEIAKILKINSKIQKYEEKFHLQILNRKFLCYYEYKTITIKRKVGRIMVEGGRGVIPRLQKLFPSLKGALRDIAQVILDSPDTAVRSNVSKLAEKSNTSESAVVRLAQRLKYKGFRDLQINLAYDLGDGGKHIDDEEIGMTDSLIAVAEKSYHANLSAITQSWETLDNAAYERAVQVLHRARVVHIFAQGANYSTGVDLCYNLMKLGLLCNVYNDSYMQAVASAISDKRDVAVGISHTGANRDVIEALSIMRQNGACTIALTARDPSPITRIAEISMYTSSKEIVFQGEPLSSRMSLMYLVDILFLGVASMMGKFALTNLQQVKDALEAKRHPN
jgi:RpiR family carbohydrate utilization transcriptional regulator